MRQTEARAQQTENCFQRMAVCSFFCAFRIKEGKVRQITGKWEKAGQGLDYRAVNKIRYYSLEGGYALFQSCVKLDA